MKTVDEDTALSLIFANTRTKRREADLLTIGKAFDYLVKLYESRKAVAEKVGLSTEMVREFLAVLKLPRQVQELVSRRVIDRIDVVREIASIGSPSRQIAVAEVFARSSSKDVRDIKRLVEKLDLPVKKAEKIVLDAKPTGMHVFVIDFDDETYKRIDNHAKVLGVSPVELVRRAVEKCLEEDEAAGA